MPWLRGYTQKLQSREPHHDRNEWRDLRRDARAVGLTVRRARDAEEELTFGGRFAVIMGRRVVHAAESVAEIRAFLCLGA